LQAGRIRLRRTPASARPNPLIPVVPKGSLYAR